jgi:transcriptional regulator with XRE-family HTH domain
MAFKNVGKALAILRARLHLSQTEFAASCGIGRSQLNRYESGRELMKLLTLEQLLDRLHVTPEEFFRFLASLDDSPLPQQRQVHDRANVLPGIFQHLLGAIDGLRAGIDELYQAVEPAVRLAALVDQAAISKGLALAPAPPLGAGQEPAPAADRLNPVGS